MQQFSYHQLQQAEQFCRYWQFELDRQLEILRRADFMEGSEMVMAAWLKVKKSTAEALGMHEEQLKLVRSEMKRRQSLVGWL